jgi:hypothetical protein
MKLRVALALWVVLVGAGCKRKTATPPLDDGGMSESPRDEVMTQRTVLDSVAIHASDIHPEAEIYADELGKNVGQELIQSRLFFGGEADVPPGFEPRHARLDIEVTHDLVPEAVDGPVALASAKARLVWLDGKPALGVREDVLVERPLKKGETPPAGEVAAHVARAARALIANLVLKEKLLRAEPDEVIAAVAGKNSDVHAWALEVIAERKIQKAYPVVAAAVDAPLREVQDAAIAALVALQNPKSIQILTRKADFKDHERLRMIMEASIAIGGNDAIDFLEFVASGHPDEHIVERANEGLRELRK